MHDVTAREQAEAILRAAIAAAAPGPLVLRALESAAELQQGVPVRLVALGKAAPAMADAAYDMLGDRIVDAVIAAPAGTRSSRPALYGAHPLPDVSSVRAGVAIRESLRSAGAGDLVLVLVSGGASATAVLPLGGITVRDYADCVGRLMRAGADIGALNTVRRHIDGLKGGRMAGLAAPAQVLGIVLSDVVGDPIDVIASGPLSPDPTTPDDALAVLHHYDLLDVCAASIHDVLTRAVRDHALRGPAPDHPLFEKVRVRIAGGNDVAIDGAAESARDLGFEVRRAVAPVIGAASYAGVSMAREARALQADGPLPACIIAGGETTVAVAGPGRGGRNQEIALAACVELAGAPGITIGSIATDGIDGPTDAAGAIADGETLQRAAMLGIDAARALADNDSHGFFSRVGGLIVTGPTGTNVNDVHVALVTAPALPPLRP